MASNGYDPSLDRTLWTSNMAPNGLFVQLISYNGGEPKISFFKQREYNGQPKINPNRRLTLEDVTYFTQLWPEVYQAMLDFGAQQPQMQ